MNLDDLKELGQEATPGPWRRGEAHAHDSFLDVDKWGIAWVGTACDRPDVSGYNFDVRERIGQRDGSFIAAARNHWDRLIAVAEAARSLLSEDGAKEALAHYVTLQILDDKLKALEADNA